jgi:hypothetical protein
MNAEQAERISKDVDPWIDEHRDNIARLVASQDFLTLAAYLCQVIREFQAYREFALDQLLGQVSKKHYIEMRKALLETDAMQQSQHVAHVICHDVREPCFRKSCIFHPAETVVGA